MIKGYILTRRYDLCKSTIKSKRKWLIKCNKYFNENLDFIDSYINDDDFMRYVIAQRFSVFDVFQYALELEERI